MVDMISRLPHESRGFVHKRFIRAAGGFLTGGPAGAATGFLTGGGARENRQQQRRAGTAVKFSASTGAGGCSGGQVFFPEYGCRPPGWRPDAGSVRLNGFAPSGNGGGCIPPFRRDPRTGQCKIFLGSQTGTDPEPIGEAVMGRYGSALVPGNRVIDRAVCLPGMQLGNDGLCYNKGNITNKERMWPAGRKPLLTGGEMRAISIAASAAGRLDRTCKRLRKIGLMKKPTPRRRITSGSQEHHHHN